MKHHVLYPLLFVFMILCGCHSLGNGQHAIADKPPTLQPDSGTHTIHVMVALCDNRYQGIVPVPAAIGNGQDAAHNLYWGCAFGIRTYFTRSKDWQLLSAYRLNDTILERVVFRNRHHNYYLVADAYDGRHIKQCTIDLLSSCAGSNSDTVKADGKVLGIGSLARLCAYVGHDGLMDFSLEAPDVNGAKQSRDLMILACYSKLFFETHIRTTGANPLLWSTGLLSPEAYTLHDALNAYMAGQPPATIRSQAARAYARYQKCSQQAAERLWVTGY